MLLDIYTQCLDTISAFVSLPSMSSKDMPMEIRNCCNGILQRPLSWPPAAACRAAINNCSVLLCGQQFRTHSLAATLGGCKRAECAGVCTQSEQECAGVCKVDKSARGCAMQSGQECAKVCRERKKASRRGCKPPVPYRSWEVPNSRIPLPANLILLAQCFCNAAPVAWNEP